MSSQNTASWSRKELTLAILAMMAVSIGIARCDGHVQEQAAQRQAQEHEYIVNHECVVAEMRGRYVASYRCDKPAPARYLTPGELGRAAQAQASAPAP